MRAEDLEEVSGTKKLRGLEVSERGLELGLQLVSAHFRSLLVETLKHSKI
jgi:hypothetical protein